MPLWVAVHGIQDGEDLKSQNLNRPTFELTERTNYLYDALNNVLGRGVSDSLTISNAVLLTEGDLAPEEQDFVYYDPELNAYVKALADVSDADNFVASHAAFSVGLLKQKRNNGTGVIVIAGNTGLNTQGANWKMSGLLEEGEDFRPGPYYLSPVVPGKMTAQPSGISVYLGYFNESPDVPGEGSFAIISPQYKDMMESHIHRTYRMYTQPAGTHYVSGDLPTDTHDVQGFKTINLGITGDIIPRIVLKGAWTGLSDTTYSLWLSNSSSPTEIRTVSTPPTSFADAYLHWESSDPAEGSGAVRVWSYEVQVPVGTKGVVASLERDDAFDEDPGYAADWDEIYSVASDDPDKRSWEIVVPLQTRGWLSRKYRQLLTPSDDVSGDYTLALIGGPHNVEGRVRDDITVVCGALTRIVYTGLPVDGDTVTIGALTYEFDTDSSVGAGNVAVGINPSDADETYDNLMQAILAQAVVGIDTALNTDSTTLIIASTQGALVSGSLTNAILVLASVGTGTVGAGSGSALVYDIEHKALVALTGYWSGISYWNPVELSNGLMLMAIPYMSDGSAATDDSVTVGDSWDVEIIDEAPGASFEYSMPMHPILNFHYPPIPFHAATLVLNGVELDAQSLFPSDPTYGLGNLSVYWYPNDYGAVPWPVDWESTTMTGDDIYVQNMVIHFIHHGMGDSAVVTSIRPAPDAPVKITRLGTNDDATTGDLQVDLSLALTGENTQLPGYNVFKEANGNSLLSGPVVERITSDGSIGISSLQGAPSGQGTVVLTAGSSQLSGEFNEVALENAKQEMVDMFPYIRLLPWETGGTGNIDSGFVAKFRVPYQVGTGLYKVLVYLTVFGDATIPTGSGQVEYAGIEYSYSILPDYLLPPGLDPYGRGGNRDELDAWSVLDQSLDDGIIKTTTPIIAEIPFGSTANLGSAPIYGAYDPMIIHNDIELTDRPRRSAHVLGNPLPEINDIADWPSPGTDPTVRAGSIVAIRVKRRDLVSATDEYSGSLGFIGMRWRLQLVSL